MSDVSDNALHVKKVSRDHTNYVRCVCVCVCVCVCERERERERANIRFNIYKVCSYRTNSMYWDR